MVIIGKDLLSEMALSIVYGSNTDGSKSRDEKLTPHHLPLLLNRQYVTETDSSSTSVTTTELSYTHLCHR